MKLLLILASILTYEDCLYDEIFNDEVQPEGSKDNENIVSHAIKCGCKEQNLYSSPTKYSI